MSFFTKFFIASVVWTAVFLSLAAYAAEQAYKQDPELITNLENKFDVTLRLGGMSKNSSAHESTEDKWTFATPTKRIVLKSISGNFSVKSSAGNEIKITATGELDRSRAPRLLKTEASDEELTLQEPDKNMVENLQVQIEVPASFTGIFEVKTVSGDAVLEKLNLQSLDMVTISGKVTLNQVNAKALALKTISGDIKLESSSIAKLEGKSVSGDLEVTLPSPASVDFTSVSGDVRMKLGKADKTRFSLKSVSGDVHNRHGSEKNGDFNVSISTTSGDIEIE